MDLAQFKVDYFGADKRKIGTFDNTVQYTLKTTPVKFKKEFKFYFLNFNYRLPKDSVSVGVTK
jgi:predicted transcriptional regulator